MNDLSIELTQWTELLKNNSIAMWDNLPDIELYMDQVITYIEKQLQLFQEEEETKLITSSMINNYVKDGVIKHAVQKKYSREHLASLIMVGLLKQVLPLSHVSKLTGIFNESDDKKAIFNLFVQTQKESVVSMLSKIEEASNSAESFERDSLLLKAALKLSCDALAGRIAAERIFKMIQVNNSTVCDSGAKPENAEKTKKKISATSK